MLYPTQPSRTAYLWLATMVQLLKMAFEYLKQFRWWPSIPRAVWLLPRWPAAGDRYGVSPYLTLLPH